MYRIRTGNHHRFGDGGMFFQGTFDLEGADAIASTDDNIIGATDKSVIAIFILIRDHQ